MRRRFWRVLGVLLGLAVLERALRAAFSGDRRRPSDSAHTYVLESTQTIPAPVGQVFPFFEDPQNLGKITPARMRFEILDIQNLPMQRGTKIEYRIRPLGIPQSWETEIVEYEPGRLFVDLQTRGPYRFWRHRHTFADVDGATLMRDGVQYQMPLGPIGRLVHFLFVSRMLRDIFDYRERVVRETFQSSAAKKEEESR